MTLVAGPVSLDTPRGGTRIDVKSAREMYSATLEHARTATYFIATAAVADWRPADAAAHKIKKDGSGATPQLRFYHFRKLRREFFTLKHA